ncbi:MAG: pitrilysin family protein [Myxococcota bacterium]
MTGSETPLMIASAMGGRTSDSAEQEVPAVNDDAIRISQHVLDNGLRVVAVEQPFLHAADVSFFVRCGSRHEGTQEWGLSHFLEHMLFRGSHRFPTGYDLACAFERRGANLNAATWRDHTHLETTAHPSTVGTILELLGDMVTHPRFDGIGVERNIIEEEIQGELDEAGEDVDLNNVSRASIWRGHAMGRRITGSIESVYGLHLEDIQRHHERYYVAQNAVLCVAGRIEPDDVFRLAAEAFRDLRPGEAAADGEAARFSPDARLTLRDSEGSQTSVALTFEALPDPHDHFVALELVTRVLDDGLGSRLHQNVCERRGLVYDLSTGLDCYADCGLYDIELTVAPHRAASAVAVTLETLEDLCENGVSEEELELVRERSLHEIEYSLDSAQELSAHFGTAALFREVEPLAEQAAKIREMGRGDLLAVARDIFHSGRVHGTLIGPLERTNAERIERLIDSFAGDVMYSADE